MASTEPAKEAGNACMAVGDFVNAMKWYSQALTVAPRDAALYSNRSFAFLKLGLPERALADADEAIRRRPDWAKAHFRRAEALSQAHVHTDALQAYSEGARLDPSDVHLQSQCAEAAVRLAAQRQTEQLQVAACALVGLLVLGLLLLAPGAAGTAGTDTGAASSYLWNGLGALLGAALGGAGGAGAIALRRHLRRYELPRVRASDPSPRQRDSQTRGRRGHVTCTCTCTCAHACGTRSMTDTTCAIQTIKS